MIRWALLFLLIASCHKHEHEEDDKKKEGEHERGMSPEGDTANTPAEEAIRAYENASDCPTREHTIVFPAQNHDALLKLGCPRRIAERFETWECEQVGAKLCHATARADKNKKRYWLVKQANGAFLVDFLATERPNRLDALRHAVPTTPMVMRVRANESLTYRGDFKAARKTHYAIKLRPATAADADADVYAYVPRDSDDARALQLLLASGSIHELTIAVAYVPGTMNPDGANIKKYFGEDFFESDAEAAYVAAATDGGT